MDVDEAVELRRQHQPGRTDWMCCGTCGDPWPCRMWRLAGITIMTAVRDAYFAPGPGKGRP